MTTNTGGPAFPHIDSGCGRFEEGMTLRDYFAAKAMQSLLSDPNVKANAIEFASRAYVVADAMLEMREQ